MAKLSIPAGPQDLTSEWLTSALRQSGMIDDAAVSSFESETIAEGVGLVGQLASVKLRYDPWGTDAPGSLIAKFPAVAEENRALGNLFRFYEREIRFYEELARKVELRTPRCYYSAMDTEAGEYVLLLEDLAPAEVGDQLAGCPRDKAQVALNHLAKFHATWWESPRIAELDWMPYVNSPVHKSVEESYQKAWGPFLELFGDRLADSVRRTGEQLGTKLCAIQDVLSRPPRTIAHGDYRFDNLFFSNDGAETKLAVIDWQIASVGRALYDAGYFMSQSVDPVVRKASEMEILRRYHSELLRNGVLNYDFEECVRDYRLATLYCFLYPVIGVGSLDLSNERGMALEAAMLERSAAAITDLNAAELLPV